MVSRRRLPGRATSEGTARYRARLAALADAGHYRDLSGLAASSVGLGTYLGADDEATDRLYADAIARALARGCNVIDSAINYRSQRSERVIGQVLASGAVARDEVIVATKGGFLPFDGARPRNPRAYLEETFFAPGILAPADVVAGCHAMTPRYLQDQIERSRNNLGVETIDVYYLHNPETQLEEVPHGEVVRRLRAAFETLERARAGGAIGWYGTATWNGYREEPGTPGHLSLEEIVRLARDVGGDDHGFRVVQLPYSLGMPEAFAARTQVRGGKRMSAIEAAQAEGIYVMTSASVLQGRLTRGIPAHLAAALGEGTDAQRALQLVRSTPGVGTALVGMKRVEHVEENLGVAATAPLGADSVRALFRS